MLTRSELIPRQNDVYAQRLGCAYSEIGSRQELWRRRIGLSSHTGRGRLWSTANRHQYGIGSAYVYPRSQKPAGEVPGRGGTLAIVDSRNFPVATNIASAVVTLEPKGLRELHWHPNVRDL